MNVFTQLALFDVKKEMYAVGSRICVQETWVSYSGYTFFISFRYF